MVENKPPLRLAALYRLRVQEGSLVDDGANPEAKIILWKRADAPTPAAEIKTMPKAAKVEKVEEAPAPMDPLATLTPDQQQAVAQALAMKDQQISALREQLAQAQAQAATNAAEAEKMPAEKMPAATEVEDKATEVAAAMMGCPACSAEVEADMAFCPMCGATLATPEGTLTDEMLSKAIAKANLPAPIRTLLEKRQAELAEVRKALATETEARLTREYVEKAAPYRLPGVTTSDLASVLREVDSRCSTEVAKAFKQILDASSEVMKHGGSVLQKALGVNTVGASGSVLAEVEARMLDVQKANPKLTAAKARALVWEQNPDLYKRYEEERKR